MVERLPGGRRIHSVRVSAQTEPWGPDSCTGMMMMVIMMVMMTMMMIIIIIMMIISIIIIIIPVHESGPHGSV